MNIKEKSEVEHGKVLIGDLLLESGKSLSNVELAYERTGVENAPAILVCHALTGNQVTVGDKQENGWWSEFIGPGKYVDTNNYKVITFNVLGGCNGSTGPLSVNPETGKPYQAAFPFLTVRDMVKAQYLALRELGIEHLAGVIGGSLGGMQVLEWGVLYPDFMDVLFPLASTPAFSDYAIAYNAIARQAIISDPKWNNGNYSADFQPEAGLSIARMIGMISYRSDDLFNQRFSRKQQSPVGLAHNETAFEIESYLHYQGKKLTKRFDANSYLYLLKAMDSHDIGRDRGGWEAALYAIRAPIVAIGYKGDLLYPPHQLRKMIDEYRRIGKEGDFYEVDTRFGHDGFLVEFEKWGFIVRNKLKQVSPL
ncbi:homoserine O-acetyltransferase MetX [Pseudalkalibacillus caeni]|uniref:Homoserine O-acetyltransferase n=1 Tax=Exobacillus caeni TaxID=2574798 RepID=A0A5R9F6Y1_9BACL|nr:homoserine O-acetyltransferase [Pseudalkalibacillus caeni]TLS38791.1 homoserine O-acetyltransferase [Pseudalkalibacillus caeni]